MNEETILIWVSIMIAIIAGGADEKSRDGTRWIALVAVGLLMIAFYL